MRKIYAGGRAISLFSFLIFLLGLQNPFFSCYGQISEIPLTTNSTEARSALIAGRDLAENQFYERAQYYFTKAILKDPACAIAYLYRAQVTPQPSIAYIKDLSKAVTLMARSSAGEQLLIQAAQAQANGQVKKEMALLQQLAQKYPSDKRVHLSLATHYLKQTDFKSAEAALRAGLALAHDFPPFSLYLGQVATKMGQFSEAARALQEYQNLLPDNAVSHQAMGNLYLKQGLFPEALNAFTAAQKMDPEFYPAYLSLSTGYLLNGKPAEARKRAKKLLDVAANDYWRRQALLLLSATYIDEGKYDKALAEAIKSKELTLKNKDNLTLATDLNYEGDIYLAQNKTAEAREHFMQARKLTESVAGFAGLKNKALLHYLSREAELALADKNLTAARQKINEYQKQAKGLQDSAALHDAYQLLGMAAIQEKKYDVAIRDFKKANLHNPRTLYLMGSAHLAKGDKAQGKMYWLAAAQFNELQYDYLLIRRKTSM